MTRMQKEMQERISREQLDQAFDARFPEEMRTKLRNARVAVAGLGGLGSNIAVMLARSGVGELLLVDFDTVDVTNLNRQMYLIPHLFVRFRRSRCRCGRNTALRNCDTEADC